MMYFRKFSLRFLFEGASTVELENSNRTTPIDLGKTYGRRLFYPVE